MRLRTGWQINGAEELQQQQQQQQSQLMTMTMETPAARRQVDDRSSEDTMSIKQRVHAKNRQQQQMVQSQQQQMEDDDDNPFTYTSGPRFPTGLAEVVGRLNMEAPAAAAAYRAVPAAAKAEQRRHARQFLARAKKNSTIIVNATRRVDGQSRPVRRDFEAKLIEKPDTSDGGEYRITFNDEDNSMFQPTYNLLEQQFGVDIHHYHPILEGAHGLPPMNPQRHGTNLMQPPAYTIYVGIHTPNSNCGTSAAAAIVVRKADEDGDTWRCDRDLALPPVSWQGDEALGRVYAGGTKKAMGSIALTAALRKATTIIAAMHTIQRHMNSKIAIVVELSAEEALKQMFAVGGSSNKTTQPTRIAGGPDGTKQFHQQRLALHNSFVQIAPHVIIASTNYSVVASTAAETKLRQHPTIGARITPEETRLFDDYNHSLIESRQRHRQQQQERAAGLPQTTIIEMASKIRDHKDFTNICRRNKSRSYVPREAQEPVANVIHAVLTSIVQGVPNSEKKDDALIAFLIAPLGHLPVGCRSSDIKRRAAEGKPWNVQVSEKQQQLKRKQQQQQLLDPDSAAGGGEEEEEQLRLAAQQQLEDAYTRVLETEEGALLHRMVMAVVDNSEAVQHNRRKEAQEELNRLAAAEAQRMLASRRAMEDITVENQDTRKHRRLAEAVERLANDFKMRSARKLLFSVVENEGKPDMPFEDKVSKLRAKVKSTETPLPDMKLDKIPLTAPFCDTLVAKAIKRMPKQAAACVDGWSRRIIEDCIKVLPDIKVLLGTVCAAIINGEFSERVYNILRLGRLVGIPKEDGGIRPLSLTCFLLKLTGTIIWIKSNGLPALKNQFAISMPDGTLRIVHPVREERKANLAIIKIDVSGAFDSARRAEIAQILTNEQVDNDGQQRPLFYDVRRYYNVLYGGPGQMAVYGPEGKTEFINVNEGVRQGDAFSGYFFALIMEKINNELEQQCPGVTVRMYMDDITITCLPRNARWVMARAISIMSDRGFTCNPDKSRIIANDKDSVGAYPIVPMEEQLLAQRLSYTEDHIATHSDFEAMRAHARGVDVPHPQRGDEHDLERVQVVDWQDVNLDARRQRERVVATQKFDSSLLLFEARQNPDADDVAECDEALAATDKVIVQGPNEMFVVLGANVSDNFDEYNTKQSKRLCGFFDVLDKIELHPQLAFTLARICGFVKARYYASVTPPEFSESVLAAFVKRTVRYMEKLFRFDIQDKEFCHHYCGMGIPDYNSARLALYHDARNGALRAVQVMQMSLVKRTSTGSMAAHLAAQHHAPWLAYQPRGHDMRLAPADFRFAMAIRCRTLPRDMHNPDVNILCVCGKSLETEGDIIDHALTCKQTGYTTAMRHTALKSAVGVILRRYGISVTMEPTYYSKHYEDGIKHRPDLVAWTNIPVATDFTIVQQKTAPGNAASRAAEEKNKCHKHVAVKCGHMFVPFVLEAHGFMHPSCTQFTREVSQQLPHYAATEMLHEMITAVSTTLARARVHAVAAIVQARDRLDMTFDEGDDLGVDDIATGLFGNDA